MQTWFCPACGQRHNVRESSIGTIKRCDACGVKSTVEWTPPELPAAPRPTHAPTGLLAVAIVGTVVACGGCFALISIGTRSSTPQQAKGPPTKPPVIADPTSRPRPTPPDNPPHKDTDKPADKTKTPPEPTPEELAAIEEERKTREAKNKAERERFEQEQKDYLAATARYDAARKLKLARALARGAEEEKEKGNKKQAAELLDSANKHYREIVNRYPATEAAAAAKQLLAGKEVEEIDLPSVPVKPKPAEILPEPRKKKGPK